MPRTQAKPAAADDLPADLFETAMTVFLSGDFSQAEKLFLQEAEANIGRFPGRAAIAYRQAALAAHRNHNTDNFDHWMRLAGREYLHLSEDAATPVQQAREAALMASRCFMEVENLNLSKKGLERAQLFDAVFVEPTFGNEAPTPHNAISETQDLLAATVSPEAPIAASLPGITAPADVISALTGMLHEFLAAQESTAQALRDVLAGMERLQEGQHRLEERIRQLEHSPQDEWPHAG